MLDANCPENPQPAADALEGLDILIIADALDSVEPLIELLRSAGAVVAAVRTGALALAYADRHTLDVILVDLREPGWWRTPEMRALRSLNRVPVYAMETGQATPAARGGVAGVFVKPVDVDALVSTLSALPRRPR